MSKYGKTVHALQVWTLLHEVTINDQRDLSVVGVSQVFITLDKAFKYIDDIQKYSSMPAEVRDWLNIGDLKGYKYKKVDECRVANGTYVAHYESQDSEDKVDVQWYVLKSKIDTGEHYRLELKEVSGRYEYKENKGGLSLMNAKKIKGLLGEKEVEFTINNDILEGALNKYKSDAAPSRETRREWLDYCDKLVDGAMANGATPEELDRIVIFCYVCIDSIKHCLNIGKAGTDLGISELYSRYVEGENGNNN